MKVVAGTDDPWSDLTICKGTTFIENRSFLDVCSILVI